MGRVYRERSIGRSLANVERQLKRQSSASRFALSGLSVPEQGVTAVSGDFQSQSFVPGSEGFRLRADGSAEFNGVLIGQDTPVQQGAPRTSAGSFSLTPTWDTKATVSVTVPAGCTRAFATVLSRMYMLNPNNSGGADGTGTDAIYVKAAIDGNFTTATPTGISGSGGFATTFGFDAFELTGLTPGDTIDLIAQGKSGFQTLTASANNYINASAAITWLR